VRLERPAHELEHVSIDVGELLRNIASDVAIEADAQGCLVNVQASGVLMVSGDPELLRSAFENVIRNAVRYSPAGSVVAIEARRGTNAASAAEAVEVTVRDAGPGVPEKELGSIFEPFFRVEPAREHRSAGGEGLGLAIAARAVTLHGGRIEARNLEGGGLMVTVSLPALAQHAAAA